jgi:hypothetical protein
MHKSGATTEPAVYPATSVSVQSSIAPCVVPRQFRNGLRLLHKPARGEFCCARVTRTRFHRGSNQSAVGLDGPQKALHGVGQIGHCEPIQWSRVCETASATRDRLHESRGSRLLSRRRTQRAGDRLGDDAVPPRPAELVLAAQPLRRHRRASPWRDARIWR